MPLFFRDPTGLVGMELRGLLILALYRLVDFPSVNRHFARRLDPESDLISTHIHDRDDYIVTDNDAFVALS